MKKILQNRLARHNQKLKIIESLVNKTAASPNQKQIYVELKAKTQELEDIIDLNDALG